MAQRTIHMLFGVLLLDKIDPEKWTVNINGVDYPLLDTNFPTVDWKDPFALSAEEQVVMDRLILDRKSTRLNSSH